MRTLGIDIETFSSNDLLSGGVYKYVEAEDFEIMLFAYSVNGGPVALIDLTRQTLPEYLIQAIRDENVLKTAYNAQFERVCLSQTLGVELDPAQWECSMAKAAMFGYPFGLDAVSIAMGLAEKKDATGKALIRYFSLPCKATKTNGGRTRNLPAHDTEKWEQFKSYCIQDVVVEQSIREKLSKLDTLITPTEKAIWSLDQRVNDRGIYLDKTLAEKAIVISEAHTETLNQEALDITSLDNPNSVTQLKRWLSQETGEDVTSLTKDALTDLLKRTDGPAARVLEIRREMGKTSVKKYQAMLSCVCSDGRVRGLVQYYGASRTGRWSGRLVQIQNLPQNHINDLDLARQLVKDETDGELLAMMYRNVPDTLSQLIRTAFAAPIGKKLIVVDFSAIEARVIAWLAGEQWRLEVFNTHGKIYEASASQMFKIPISEIGKGSELRQKGKIAELALGYQGAVGALMTMGAVRMGLKEEELPKIVALWRGANKKIVQLWNDIQNAAAYVVAGDEPKVTVNGKVSFTRNANTLFITLPSGRKLCYLRPTHDGKGIHYYGIDQTTKTFQKIDTYGGKLVENITQAIARDLLAEAMLRLDARGYKIVSHIHDEVVIEIDENKVDELKNIEKIMAEPVAWAKGLPLRADGFSTKYYRK